MSGDNGGVLGIWCLGIMEVFLEFGVWDNRGVLGIWCLG